MVSREREFRSICLFRSRTSSCWQPQVSGEGETVVVSVLLLRFWVLNSSPLSFGTDSLNGLQIRRTRRGPNLFASNTAAANHRRHWQPAASSFSLLSPPKVGDYSPALPDSSLLPPFASFLPSSFRFPSGRGFLWNYPFIPWLNLYQRQVNLCKPICSMNLTYVR